MQTREDTRSAVLKRKLSGVKNFNHDPRPAEMSQGIAKSDMEPLREVKLHDHVSQREEGQYELQLHEHDFQPHDVK
jgi:hypothetical protein